MLSDEHRYRILKVLAVRPDLNQRQLAAELGISLGKTNYCLRALIEKGLLKANNFRNSANKRAYVYFLTPKGIEEKAQVTIRFLRRKVADYEALEQEIQTLRAEVAKVQSAFHERQQSARTELPSSILKDTPSG